jgi:hypothetical protein
MEAARAARRGVTPLLKIRDWTRAYGGRSARTSLASATGIFPHKECWALRRNFHIRKGSPRIRPENIGAKKPRRAKNRKREKLQNHCRRNII